MSIEISSNALYLASPKDTAEIKPRPTTLSPGKPQEFDGKAVATPEKIPGTTKEAAALTPVGEVPYLGSPTRKKDVVDLSAEAQAKLSGAPSAATQPNVQLRPPALSDAAKRAIASFTNRIEKTLAQFKGQPDTQETRDKISAALKDAGLHPDQIRLTDPNTVTTISADERARRQLIISQFNQAYNSWRA